MNYVTRERRQPIIPRRCPAPCPTLWPCWCVGGPLGVQFPTGGNLAGRSHSLRTAHYNSMSLKGRLSDKDDSATVPFPPPLCLLSTSIDTAFASLPPFLPVLRFISASRALRCMRRVLRGLAVKFGMSSPPADDPLERRILFGRSFATTCEEGVQRERRCDEV